MDESFTNRLANKFIDDLTKREENAKKEFESIKLKTFLAGIINKCLDESANSANEVLSNHFKDLKENYLQNELNNQQYLWEQNVLRNYREDNTVYRQAIKIIRSNPNYPNLNQDERRKEVLYYIINHINKNIRNYKERLRFINEFESDVKESVLYETLFNHLKRLEKDNKYLSDFGISKDELSTIKKLVSIKIQELDKFINGWFVDRNNELSETTPTNNSYPFYCEIGVLFAKGLIQFKDQEYYYQDNHFVSIAKLSEHIQKEVLKTNKAVRQYVNDTLFETGTKNFYSSSKMMKNIIDFCNSKNIDVVKDFQDKYTKLENLH
ncbi:MAG: hypothetical protein ACK5NB_08525 [Flavobacteriaceae bacterium]